MPDYTASDPRTQQFSYSLPWGPEICLEVYCLTEPLNTLNLFMEFRRISKIKIYRTVSLPVVLFGFEAWSVALSEERRLRVFENKGLRKIF